MAHVHPLVTQSIDSLSYRQYNYHLMMSHSTQLARWLHKILSHSYVNASYTVPYGAGRATRSSTSTTPSPLHPHFVGEVKAANKRQQPPGPAVPPAHPRRTGSL